MYQALVLVFTRDISFGLHSPMTKAHCDPHFSDEDTKVEAGHPALWKVIRWGFSARDATLSLGDMWREGHVVWGCHSIWGGQAGFPINVSPGQCVE